MTSGSAPAARTAAAVSSRFSRPRAASVIAEKSRARRMAVARPMPWLAPVTIATDLDVSMVGTPKKASGEEFADCRGDLDGVGLQGEMTAIEEPDDRLRNVALERLGPRRQEERIVLAPHGKQRRLVGAEIAVKTRIERDIALVVAQQIELDLVGAGSCQVEIVERLAVG